MIKKVLYAKTQVIHILSYFAATQNSVFAGRPAHQTNSFKKCPWISVADSRAISNLFHTILRLL